MTFTFEPIVFLPAALIAVVVALYLVGLIKVRQAFRRCRDQDYLEGFLLFLVWVFSPVWVPFYIILSLVFSGIKR
jgi:uncharacterized membrane protein